MSGLWILRYPRVHDFWIFEHEHVQAVHPCLMQNVSAGVYSGLCIPVSARRGFRTVKWQDFIGFMNFLSATWSINCVPGSSVQSIACVCTRSAVEIVDANTDEGSWDAERCTSRCPVSPVWTYSTASFLIHGWNIQEVCRWLVGCCQHNFEIVSSCCGVKAYCWRVRTNS